MTQLNGSLMDVTSSFLGAGLSLTDTLCYWGLFALNLCTTFATFIGFAKSIGNLNMLLVKFKIMKRLAIPKHDHLILLLNLSLLASPWIPNERPTWHGKTSSMSSACPS